LLTWQNETTSRPRLVPRKGHLLLLTWQNETDGAEA